MKTCLGVLVAGEVFGKLYLAEKHHEEEFTEEDERAGAPSAEFAGLAIAHARRYM